MEKRWGKNGVGISVRRERRAAADKSLPGREPRQNRQTAICPKAEWTVIYPQSP